MTSILMTKGDWDRHAQGGEGAVSMSKQRIYGQGTAKMASKSPGMSEGPQTGSPSRSQKEPTLPTTRSQTSDPQINEMMNLCCFSHPRGGALSPQP